MWQQIEKFEKLIDEMKDSDESAVGLKLGEALCKLHPEVVESIVSRLADKILMANWFPVYFFP